MRPQNVEVCLITYPPEKSPQHLSKRLLNELHHILQNVDFGSKLVNKSHELHYKPPLRVCQEPVKGISPPLGIHAGERLAWRTSDDYIDLAHRLDYSLTANPLHILREDRDPWKIPHIRLDDVRVILDGGRNKFPET